MRLLCDEMLGSTARWLRAAGYDAALAQAGESDAQILARCRALGRVLVTRDRALAATAGRQVPTVLLNDEDEEGQALQLAQALGVDWTAGAGGGGRDGSNAGGGQGAAGAVSDLPPLRAGLLARKPRAPDAGAAGALASPGGSGEGAATVNKASSRAARRRQACAPARAEASRRSSMRTRASSARARASSPWRRRKAARPARAQAVWAWESAWACKAAAAASRPFIRAEPRGRGRGAR
jgi:hypothetical protein